MGDEESGVGAASIRRREAVVPSAGLGLGDVRTKPISMMETERQQTVQSHVSGALALREHLLVTNRPPNPPVPACCCPHQKLGPRPRTSRHRSPVSRVVRLPSPQADASSTWDSGLIVTSMVRQIEPRTSSPPFS
jgi:hypothetical protein